MRHIFIQQAISHIAIRSIIQLVWQQSGQFAFPKFRIAKKVVQFNVKLNFCAEFLKSSSNFQPRNFANTYYYIHMYIPYIGKWGAIQILNEHLIIILLTAVLYQRTELTNPLMVFYSINHSIILQFAYLEFYLCNLLTCKFIYAPIENRN